MPERKISSGPRQMDCSDGAKMLIDQMKEHPEEFRGYAGKFTAILDKAREAIQGLHRNVWMSKRDAEAILAAAETHLYEVWLAEDVLTAIMLPKQEDEPNKVYATPVKAGLWQGAVPGSIYAGHNTANTKTVGPSYDEYVHIARMEQEKYRLELEKLRQQEYEHAQRNTKPFGKFL
jgi:cytochrome c551/c552